MTALPAVAEDKNAVVPFTPPLHHLLLYPLPFNTALRRQQTRNRSG